MEMTRRLPSLKALRAFESLSRHLTLTKSAEELHVTPAAVNQLIRSLEADLGFDLFRRGNRQYTLTEAAQAGIADLRDGFSRITHAVDRMCQSASHAQVTISVVPSLASIWLVPRLERFRREQPDLDVLIEISSELTDFTRSTVDMAIRYGSGQYPGLHVVELFHEEFFPVCSPELAKGEVPLRSPADLRHHTLLHVDWTPADGQWPNWQDWLDASGTAEVDVTHGPRFSHQHLAYQAALHAQGIALGSTALVSDDLAAGRLVKPFKTTIPASFGYYIVCPKDRAEEWAISAFRDWLLEEARG